MKFVNIFVKNNSKVNLNDCTAELIGLVKDGESTAFDRSIPLIWNEPANSKITKIIAGRERIVHIAKSNNRDNKLGFVGEPEKWNRIREVFNPDGMFRFDVLINAGGISQVIKIDVEWQGSLDTLKASEASKCHAENT